VRVLRARTPFNKKGPKVSHRVPFVYAVWHVDDDVKHWGELCFRYHPLELTHSFDDLELQFRNCGPLSVFLFCRGLEVDDEIAHLAKTKESVFVTREEGVEAPQEVVTCRLYELDPVVRVEVRSLGVQLQPTADP